MTFYIFLTLIAGFIIYRTWNNRKRPRGNAHISRSNTYDSPGHTGTDSLSYSSGADNFDGFDGFDGGDSGGGGASGDWSDSGGGDSGGDSGGGDGGGD